MIIKQIKNVHMIINQNEKKAISDSYTIFILPIFKNMGYKNIQ